MPAEPQMFRCEVLRTVRHSPTFQRVTISGPDLKEFEWLGGDHWFRLFLPNVAGQPLVLPEFEGRQWWTPYLEIPESDRPHCSNYTVADFRRTLNGCEMDIDVVLHWDEAGEVAGKVAQWATSASIGSPVAILDQGLLYDNPGRHNAIVIVSDETGLPGVRGIISSLPAASTGHVLLEVGEPEDVESIDHPVGVSLEWLVRSSSTEWSDSVAGAMALSRLQRLTTIGAVDPDSYGYLVGESTLATEGRRALCRAGMNKKSIFFSGFWKHTPHAVDAIAS